VALLLIAAQLDAKTPTGNTMHDQGQPMHQPGRNHRDLHKPKDLRSTMELLIGEADYQYTGTRAFPTDSQTYSYSNGRGYSSMYGEWLYDTSVYYTYDTATGIYTPGGRYIFNYTANNFYLNYFGQSWDSAANGWVSGQQDLYSINAAGYYDTVIVMYWNTGTSSWANSYRDVYILNSSNQDSIGLYQSWNSGTLAWVPNEEEYFSYDSSGNCILYTNLAWNTVTNSWDSTYIYSYIYDGQHDPTSQIDLQYDSAFRTWSVYRASLFSGFVDHQPTLSFGGYGMSGGVLDTATEYLATYDAYGFQLSYQLENYVGGGAFVYEAGDNSGYLYYRTDSTVGIAQISAEDVKLYPNPTTGTCHLSLTSALADYGTMTITDLSGRMVKTITLSGSETTFQTNDMSTGMYLCTISSGGKAISTKKLVVN